MFSKHIIICITSMAQCFSLSADSVGQETIVSKEILGPFLQEYCIQCHGPNKQKAKLRFDTIDFAISNGNEALHYQDILDVLNSAEMPPEEKAQPSSDELERVIGELTDTLFKARKQLASSGGKVVMRRLNRREYATTIDHLFGFVPATSKIPPDGDIENFDTVGSRQYFTTEHLDQYYELGQEILSLAFKWAGKKEPVKTVRQDPEKSWTQRYRNDIENWKGVKGKVVRLSKMREEYLALPKVESGVYLSEPLRHLSYGFSIDPRGTYQLSVISGIEGEVQPFRQFIKVGSNEGIAGVFHVDGTADNPTESTVKIRPIALKGGNSIRGYVSEDRTGSWLSHYLNSLYHHEGVDQKSEGLIWIDSFKIEGPFYPKRRSFFDMLLCPQEPSSDENSKMVWEDSNARELITRFTEKAFRHREADSEYISGLATFFKTERKKGKGFEQAMINTMAIILASPSFLFLNEEDNVKTTSKWLAPRDRSIRLSYFLTSGPPDEALYESVEKGEMTDRKAYHRQIDRILDKNNRQLAMGFGSQWADFTRFDSISVSSKFPTYASGLRHSMKEEVIAYFQTMIEENLPVSNLIKSDFATVNAQMAIHYGISGVKSNAFVKVDLPTDSPRGGYLTQAAFLVAGSNGERTSPAVRGMILMNRFLNSPPAPPPPNVPELGEGADGPLTNRKLVALHTSQAQCASCHRKMDTIGLALENFDVIGRYREAERVGHSDVPITIDGSLPGGKPFKSFSQFQETLLFHEEDLARNMIESLAVYALGRDIEFTDEPHIQNMISKLRPNGFRMRDMIHAVAESPIFFNN